MPTEIEGSKFSQASVGFLRVCTRSGSLRWFLAGPPILVISYLCLRASPRLEDIRWIPHFVSRWADAHGRWCNLPAFGLLAVILMVAFGRFRGVLMASVLAIGLECLQRFIPTRFFDWADIAISLLGVALAAGVGWWLKRSSPANAVSP